MKPVSNARLFYCLFVLLLNCLFVLFTITIVSCDSSDGIGTSGDPDASGPCTNCKDATANNSDNANGQPHVDSDDTTGNDTIHVDTIDPLTDYYWLEGQWKHESVNGIPEGTIVDVTVEAWDDELGAEIHGILPFNVSYIKKNSETNEFNFFSDDGGNGSWGEGKANQDTLTLEFEYHNIPVGKTYYNIYVKL